VRARLTRRWYRSTARIIRSRATASTRPARCAGPMSPISTKSSPTTRADGCSSAPIPIIARPGKPRGIAAARARLRTRRGRMAEHESAGQDNDQSLLMAEGLSKSYGRLIACRDVSFALYPGEVLAVVGAAGSRQTTLLQFLSGEP